MLASTITWNAYNKFGGRSNYFSQDGLTGEPVVNARQDLGRYTTPDTWPFEETAAPLSFDRPAPNAVVPQEDAITDPIRGRMASGSTPGEWRLLGWLDREGFDYDLYSETELHFDRIPLESYRVLVLNTHPEYWTAQMYQRVKQWVHHDGGRLMYLAGCGMYAEVEFADDPLPPRGGTHAAGGIGGSPAGPGLHTFGIPVGSPVPSDRAEPLGVQRHGPGPGRPVRVTEPA